MKEFIEKWSNWWILAPKRKQIDEAFEKELVQLIKNESAKEVGNKNAIIDPKKLILSYFDWHKKTGCLSHKIEDIDEFLLTLNQ